MNHNELLQASCRIALAGLLHDIGKFAERAKINVEHLDDNKQLYCPHHKNYEKDQGWFSHVHAAYTGLAIDLIEAHASKFKTGFPFAETQADDSLINAAARHHKPDTFLQWIIATADRVASGLERETFEKYNQAKDENNGLNHYTSRQITLFEQIHLGEENDRPKKDIKDFNYRYSLKPLSPASIFPIQAKGYESNNNETAQAEYNALWNQFIEGLKDIPKSHRDNLALWIDHFDSCYQTYTHTIPSATAFGTKPEVSLYDHSKAVAALAVALWRYHHDLNHDTEQATKAMQSRDDWDNEKLLLIQADFFGIQNFIFAHGGDSTKKAAKLLRGRSFYVSLITECAALKVLETLSLPSTSQIINAAGKFLIVAPNTEETIKQLETLQQEFNQWFLKHSYGQSGLGLAWQAACCNDFINSKEHKFKALMKNLHEKLERSKYQHFDLCGQNFVKPVFEKYLNDFEYGESCSVNEKVPATIKKIENNKEIYYSALSYDQINIGKWLTNKQRIFIAPEKINGLNVTEADLFGFYIHFTEQEDRTGKFGKEARNNIRRAFDFSCAKSSNEPLWNGYSRRNIGGYVPYFKAESEWAIEKYEKFLTDEDREEINSYEPKTLNHLALDDLQLNNGSWYGIKALSVLKGDIDNLGAIFQNGLEQPTFAKMAALSRQVNNFFAVYLPWLCQEKYPNTYIVFAGGDDFFLLGSWKQLMNLASELRTQFQDYVADNKDIHFSAGLTVMKPKIPIYQLADIAEESLEKSKAYKDEETEKNAITCFGKTVSWSNFDKLSKESYQRLNDLRKDYNLSTGYIYGLLKLVDMASDNTKPENSLWRSQLYYRTYRMIANNRELDKEHKKRACEVLVIDIGEQGIRQFYQGYQIVLHAHLYTHRKQA